MHSELLGIISVHFTATDQLLITYTAFVKYSRKNKHTMGQCMRDFKKAYDSARREVNEFGITNGQIQGAALSPLIFNFG
jgi:hypothetical protein